VGVMLFDATATAATAATGDDTPHEGCLTDLWQIHEALRALKLASSRGRLAHTPRTVGAHQSPCRIGRDLLLLVGRAGRCRCHATHICDRQDHMGKRGQPQELPFDDVPPNGSPICGYEIVDG
jgi:hypothetical protein